MKIHIRFFEFFVVLGLLTAIYLVLSPKLIGVLDHARFRVFENNYYTLKAAAHFFCSRHNGLAVDTDFYNRTFDITDTNYNDGIEGIEKYIDTKTFFSYEEPSGKKGTFLYTVSIFTGNIQEDFKRVLIVARSSAGTQVIIDDSDGIEDEWKLLAR